VTPEQSATPSDVPIESNRGKPEEPDEAVTVYLPVVVREGE
jgi:hypothetical protein